MLKRFARYKYFKIALFRRWVWRTLLCDGLLVIALLVGLSTACSAEQNATAPQIGSPDVQHLTQVLRAELELVRQEMGKPLVPHPVGTVSRVAPREVYFQALTLFSKVNRLSFELIRETSPEFDPLVGEIRPAQVYAVVGKALAQLRRVKQVLGIVEKIVPFSLSPKMTPTDVFQTIAKANRQLNIMLARRFNPSDVYQEVTKALAYTISLRELFPQPGIPVEVPLVRRKLPVDVYRKLLENLKVVRKIIENSGFEMMEFEPLEANDITPSDVFDVASLLVAELVFLHSQAPNAVPPRKTCFPGDKFPAHVYQRAGLLYAALIDLDKETSKDPTWLEGH